MEKVKSLLHSGSKKHDDIPAGSEQSSDLQQSGSHTNPSTGQGSHFGSSRTVGNDPISSSTIPTSASGGTSTGTHGLSEPYSSRMPGGFDDDAATTASVKSGVPGTSQSNDPSLNTNKALPQEPVSTGSGLAHSSDKYDSPTESGLTGTSLPDRSIDRHRDPIGNPSAAGDSGRSFPLGGNAQSNQTGSYTSPSEPYGAGTTTAPPSSGRAAQVGSGVNAGNAGYGSGTGPTPNIEQQGSLRRDAPLGASSGNTADSWRHEHGTHGHTYSGDPCQDPSSTPGLHMVPGPHATDTANRLDPHVSGGFGSSGTSTSGTGVSDLRSNPDSALGSSTTSVPSSSGVNTSKPVGAGLAQTGGSGLSSSTAPTESSSGTAGTDHRHHGHDVASASGNGAAELRAYEDNQHQRGSGSAGAPSTTTGPHKSDLLNKLDPRVKSSTSNQQGTTGGLESSSTGSGLGPSASGMSEPYPSSNTGRDPALSNTRGTDPYASSTTGRDHELTNPRPSDTNVSPATRGDHHYGRDAALAGTGGAAAYELEKGHASHKPTGAASGFDASNPYSSHVDPRVSSMGESQNIPAPQHTAGSGIYNAEPEHHHTSGHHSHGQQSERNHHHGRDAAAVGAGGVGAYEADKHLGNHGTTAHDPTLGHQAQNQQSGKDHHYGRDAAAVGAGGVGAYEADKHLGNHGATAQDRLAGSGHEPFGTNSSSTAPQDRLAGSGHPGTFAGNRGAAQDQYNTPDQKTHAGRDAALAAGAGAGAGALSSHEYSEKEAERLQKQHAKEEKALEKEHLKEVKHHDRMLAKEEKQHDKAIAKEENKHDKAVAAEEKKHEKHDGEKKHGGLMGFLHRDKPDKELKEEEAQRQVSRETGGYGGAEDPSSARGGVLRNAVDDGKDRGGAGAPLAGSEAGLHSSPISSGPTTHAAYGSHEGHNKLHKDPPAKVLEARGYQP